MAEPQYRFGGPIPESVQRLKERRALRAPSPAKHVCQVSPGKDAQEYDPLTGFMKQVSPVEGSGVAPWQGGSLPSALQPAALQTEVALHSSVS